MKIWWRLSTPPSYLPATDFIRSQLHPREGISHNREGAKVSKGVRDNFWLQGMIGSHKSQYDTIKAFSETDFTEDLKKIDILALVLHGGDDQIVSIDAAGRASAKILKNAKLKVYPGYPNGMCQIHADEINAHLLAFIKS